jgi:hydrogenase nickel incorporation protein HypA/HybF
VHELSVAGAVLQTVERHAAGRPVTHVCLRVGGLRQVVPDSLTFYWSVVTRGTVCEDARLECVEVDIRLHCSDCGEDWTPDWAAFRCPACGSAQVTVVAGEELEVDYIEVEEPGAAAAGREEATCTGPR